MKLISIGDIDEVLGSVIAKDDYSGNRVLPSTELAQENYLIPEIGEEFFAVVVKYLNNNPDALDSEKYDALLARIKKVVVWGTYFEYLFFALGQDTGNGIVETVAENSKPVRIGILDERKKRAKINLGREIDRLMAFLFRNRADYTEWAETDSAKESLSLFVRSGVELGKALPESFGSYWLWKRMRQNMIQMTDDLLKPVLGVELLVVLNQKLQDDELVEPYKELRKLCANYVSAYIYHYIMPSLTLVITEGGSLRVQSEFDGINNAKAATEEQMNRLMAGLDLQTKDALSAILRFLKEKDTDLPEYTIVISEVPDKMKLPPFMRNRDKLKVFGL